MAKAKKKREGKRPTRAAAKQHSFISKRGVSPVEWVPHPRDMVKDWSVSAERARWWREIWTAVELIQEQSVERTNVEIWSPHEFLLWAINALATVKPPR